MIGLWSHSCVEGDSPSKWGANVESVGLGRSRVIGVGGSLLSKN